MKSATAPAYPPLVKRVRAAQLPPPAERQAIRTAARASLADIGREIGVSAMTVQRWERGTTEPRMQHAIAYRRVLDGLRRALGAA